MSDRHVIPFPWCFLVSRYGTVYDGSRVVETDHHSCHNEIERRKTCKNVRRDSLPLVDPRVSRQDADGTKMVKRWDRTGLRCLERVDGGLGDEWEDGMV